ncbi:MAG: endonuclease V, partial [Myxococcota bacterium]
MDIARHLDIPTDQDQAFARQRELATELELTPPIHTPRLIGAADVAYSKEEGRNEAYAAVVVLDRDTMQVIDSASWVGPPPFDYLPGLFALREAATLIEAFRNLKTRPDVMLIDGHGIAHPRRFGLACQLGLVFDLPTIGCAKKRLCGQAEP